MLVRYRPVVCCVLYDLAAHSSSASQQDRLRLQTFRVRRRHPHRSVVCASTAKVLVISQQSAESPESPEMGGEGVDANRPARPPTTIQKVTFVLLSVGILTLVA